MISETLAAGLAQYKIGAKVRALRLNKKLGLVQLGEHTGLSSAMLSKIERGQVFPTLPTLLRIALVFGVGLDHFFVDEARPLVAVTRKQDRLRLPDRRDAKASAYFFESLDFPVADRKIEGYYAEFPAHSIGAAPPRRGGTDLRAEGPTRRDGRRRRPRAPRRRRHVLRLRRAAQLPSERAFELRGDRGGDRLGGVRSASAAAHARYAAADITSRRMRASSLGFSSMGKCPQSAI
jgi:transcriptional regulator with XRE-family HTH domain